MRDYKRKEKYNKVKEEHLKKLDLFLKKHNECINKRQNGTKLL